MYGSNFSDFFVDYFLKMSSSGIADIVLCTFINSDLSENCAKKVTLKQCVFVVLTIEQKMIC